MTETPSKARERREVIAEALREIVAPVRTQIEEIDADLAAIEEQKAELLVARREAVALLRVANPGDPLLPTKPGPKSLPKTQYPASEESVETLREWLRENAEVALVRNGFTGAEIARANGLAMSPDTVRRSLHALAERGVIRLDRKGRGGARVYKLAT